MSAALRRTMPTLLSATRTPLFPSNAPKTASPNDKGTHSEEAVHADRQDHPEVEKHVRDKKHKPSGEKKTKSPHH